MVRLIIWDTALVFLVGNVPILGVTCLAWQMSAT